MHHAYAYMFTGQRHRRNAALPRRNLRNSRPGRRLRRHPFDATQPVQRRPPPVQRPDRVSRAGIHHSRVAGLVALSQLLRQLAGAGQALPRVPDQQEHAAERGGVCLDGGARPGRAEGELDGHGAARDFESFDDTARRIIALMPENPSKWVLNDREPLDGCLLGGRWF